MVGARLQPHRLQPSGRSLPALGAVEAGAPIEPADDLEIDFDEDDVARELKQVDRVLAPLASRVGR